MDSILLDNDARKLRKFGYTQAFSREFTLLTNFSVSFSVISTITGIVGSLGIAWNSGGPVSAVWGWVLVSVMTMFVGLAMAEIVSACPHAGGPYFWASVLSGRYAPFVSWITAWLNLVGQVAITSSIIFSCATLLSSQLLLFTGGAGVGVALTDAELLGLYAVILIAAGGLNAFNSRSVAWLSGFSVVWQLGGLFVLLILIPAVAPTHQSASFVFGKFFTAAQSGSGLPSNLYVFLVGMLMSQYTITGYDASAHLAEETRQADINCPRAIVLAIASSALAGWALLLALLFSIQDGATLDNGTAGGYVAGQIFYDAFNARFESGGGGVIALFIPAISMFLCGMSSITSNSRMIFGMSRDQGLPIKMVSTISPWTGTPLCAIAFSITCAFILGLPLLNSQVAYSAVVSIGTIGNYIAYAIPILCRLTISRNSFEPGPFNLGRLSKPVGWVAVLWVAFITAVFVLPTTYPVTPSTLNYSGVTVGIVLLVTITWWWSPVYGARGWFKGARGTLRRPRAATASTSLLSNTNVIFGVHDMHPDAETPHHPAAETPHQPSDSPQAPATPVQNSSAQNTEEGHNEDGSMHEPASQIASHNQHAADLA
ncbi:hypothetical protein WJX73_008244 [Symbiochloris irregularis]|uniref:Amino acid transporter n=1 Tax=Symbiochloris irregularis TaxID=706552 RepID=A0AAW1PDU1_9CHLO